MTNGDAAAVGGAGPSGRPERRSAERRSRRPTIQDVAARAGVSPSTVSHAFSGKRPISEVTRERIRRAAHELGYVANPHARSMRTRRSGVIGLALRPRFAVSGSPDAAETFSRLVGTAATQCLRRGVGLLHVPIGPDLEVPALPMDGCIVAHPYEDDAVLRQLERWRMPTVCIDPDPARPADPWCVRVDYEPHMDDVFAGLASSGARSVLVVTGTEDNAWNLAGRRVAARWAQRLDVDECGLAEGASAPDVEHLIASALAARERTDAIVYAVSSMTGAVLSAVARRGLSVPGDILVATLTDSTHARRAEPPVTALDLPHERLAVCAVDLMLDRIGGAEPPPGGPVVLAPEVRWRRSSGAR